MRSRFVRLGVVAAGVLALLGSSTAPAPATATAREAEVAGVVTLGAPLGYPCTGNKMTPGTPKCLPPTATVHLDLPLPHDLPGTNTNVHVHWGQTVPIVTIEDEACADVGENVNKPPKAPAHAGTCTFSEVPGHPKNHVNGFCGLSGGQAVVTFVDALGQAWVLDVHFNGVGGTLALTGHARKVSTGRVYKLTGVITAVPVPEPLPLPATHPPNNSCAAKTARNFTIVGTVAWGGNNL